MKKTTIERLAVRGKEMLKSKLLPATAAICTLLGSTPTATAAEIYGEDQSVNVTEVTKLPATSTVDDTTQVMDLYPDMGVDSISQSDVTEVTTQELSQTLESTLDSPKRSKIDVHGGITLGTGVLGDFGDKVSDNITPIVYLDANHPKTGVGFRIIRVDDFSNDSDHPFSKVTEINPYITRTFGENGQLSVTGEFKYDLVDKSPESNGCAADAVLSYKTENGWSLDGTYTHRFTGKGSDVLRLGVSKAITDDFNLGAQVWVVDTNRDGGFYYRVSGTKDLGKGFSLQGGVVVKDGVTPNVTVSKTF